MKGVLLVKDSSTRLVCNHKCKKVFDKQVPHSWRQDIKAYITRQHDFVLLSEQLYFVNKADGTITTGPKIQMPLGLFEFRWAVDTPKGLVFMVSTPQDVTPMVFMISAPKKASKFQEMGPLVWKKVPLTNTMASKAFQEPFQGGHDFEGDCLAVLNAKYLLLSRFTNQSDTQEYHILDHSGHYIALKSIVNNTPIFWHSQATLDVHYLVLGSFIYDLSKGAKCVYGDYAKNIKDQAISNSYICFLSTNRQSHGQEPCDKVLIWSKVKREKVGLINLATDFYPANINIMEDRIALISGSLVTDPYCFQLHALDLKTHRVRVHTGNSSNQEVLWDIVAHNYRHGATTLCSARQNMWQDLHITYTQ